MHFRLLRNGIDSLQFGLNFYYQYLRLEDKYDDNNPGLLKMSVISIHNAIELLSKKLLSEVNEILIYKKLDSEILLELLGEQRNASTKGMTNIPLEWSLISSNADIHTIDYNDCIKRMTTIFKLSDNQKQTLDELGNLRNQVTHFGINKGEIDFFRVLIVINRALKLIMDFFYKELKSNDEEHHLNALSGDLEDIVEEATYVIEKHWSTFYSENFSSINNALEELKDNEKMNQYLETNGLKMEITTGPYIESQDLSIIIKNNQNDSLIHIDTYHVPDSDFTLFLDYKSGLIYFLIDHNAMLFEQSDLYIYKSFKVFDDPDLLIDNIDYWKKLRSKKKDKSQEQNECIRKEFNIPNIIDAITKATNATLKNKFI